MHSHSILPICVVFLPQNFAAERSLENSRRPSSENISLTPPWIDNDKDSSVKVGKGRAVICRVVSSGRVGSCRVASRRVASCCVVLCCVVLCCVVLCCVVLCCVVLCCVVFCCVVLYSYCCPVRLCPVLSFSVMSYFYLYCVLSIFFRLLPYSVLSFSYTVFLALRSVLGWAVLYAICVMLFYGMLYYAICYAMLCCFSVLFCCIFLLQNPISI